VGTLQFGRDGVRFGFADPDKQIALDLGILEDNDPAIVCKVDAHALDEASNEHGYLPFLTCWGPRRARYDLLYHHRPPIAYEPNGLPRTPLSFQGRGDLGIDVPWRGLSATVRASSTTMPSPVP
jgi:hypothetical protein